MCLCCGRYMAPEMKAKEPYNHSVDWYSLGKLIVDCQGRNPYAEQNVLRASGRAPTPAILASVVGHFSHQFL